MGQKVHPIGFRLGVTKDWQAKWYADRHYTELLQEDLKIRGAIESKYAEADISRVEIERAANQVTVTVYTARPGIVIGRGGQRVDEMRLFLEGITGKRIRLNIQEIRQPELDAYLVASNIAHQMERRISHRRAMKQAIFRTMEGGAQGIKVTCSGRLTGSEYSRKETLHQGRVPLQTLRADIDYAIAEAHTNLGRSGVKVWIYKGDILPETKMPPIEELPPGGVMAWGEGESAEVVDKVEEEKAPAEVVDKVEEEQAPVEVHDEVEEEKAPAEVVDEVEEEKAPAEVLDEVEEAKPKVKVRDKTKKSKPLVEVRDEVEEEKASVEVKDDVEEEKPQEEQQVE